VRNIEINDVKHRYLLTKSSVQEDILRETGATVVSKGKYYPDKLLATEEDPPLYLNIIAPTKSSLDKATEKIQDLILSGASLLPDPNSSVFKKVFFLL
jgi:hypothetical protein